MVLGGRPDYRFDSRTIKRDSRASSLIMSYRELKTLHYLHHYLLLILGGSLCEDLGLFHSFKVSPRSSNSESVRQSYHCFSGLLHAVLGTPWTRGF